MSPEIDLAQVTYSPPFTNPMAGYSADFVVLAAVLDAHGLVLKQAERLHGGVNMNWLTQDFDGDPYVVREHRSTCTVPWDRIVAYTDQATPFGCTTFLRTDTGPLVTVGERNFLIRPYIHGTVTDRLTMVQARQVGRKLTTIAAHEWDDPTVFGPAAMLTLKEPSPKMPVELLELAEEATAILDRIMADPAIQHTIIHGDLRGGNIVFGDNGELTPFDWEGAGHGPAIFDLAASLIGCCWDDGRLDVPLATAMIHGYGPVAHSLLQDALLVARTKHSMCLWWRQDEKYARFMAQPPKPPTVRT